MAIGLIIDEKENFLIVTKTSYNEHQWANAGGGFEWPDELIERNIKNQVSNCRGQQQTVFLVKFLFHEG